MRILCVGGGPAGLYFSVCAAQFLRDADIHVVERRSPAETDGWGIVYWDDLLDDLFRNDPVTAREIWARSVVWDGQQVRIAGREPIHLGGYGYGLARRDLLDLLTRRATELGVRISFRTAIDADGPEIARADLVVAADGAHSRLRTADGTAFRSRIRTERNRFVWLATDAIFPAFTFAFEPTSAGWVWCHAYRYTDERSTFIVECTPDTWRGIGFDRMGRAQTLACLRRIFARHLGGADLIAPGHPDDPRAPWRRFERVDAGSWVDGKVVLAGDAAHTTHYAIGSGTALAMRDGAALAARLASVPDPGTTDLAAALSGYETERRSATAGPQAEADRSTRWFAALDTEIERDPVEFAYALWARRGDPPPWRRSLHVATQYPGVRRLRRWAGAARRRSHAVRRERAARAVPIGPGPLGPAT